MPQEKRKYGRGRRGEEKEKKAKVLDELRARVEGEGDDGEARPAKRLRLTPPPEQAYNIPLDQPDEQHDDRGNDNTYQVYEAESQDQRQDDRPEAQFFGMLDDSEQQYFKRADLMLENDSFADAEERALFLNSVWNEAKGKELKVACSQSCSRVLERLIKGSTPPQLKAAWSRMQGNFLALVQHRFASHCVEAIFMAAAPVVSRELLGEGEEEEHKANDNEYEDEDAEATRKSMVDFYTETIEELKENLGFLITDSFASHTIRVLLVALSGRPMAGSKSLLQSKKKEKVYAAGKQDPAMLEARVVPESFGTSIKNLIRDTITNLDDNYLRALATNALANPVLQLFLELEFAASGKQKAKDEKSLFRRLLPDETPSEGTQTAAFVKGLLYGPVGSRLLETIVQHAPGKTFKTIYRTLFKDNFGNVVRNDIAGFVIIKILDRLSSEELQSATEQIVPTIPLLIERARHSIIKCLVERCRIRGVSTKPVAAALIEAFGEPGQALLQKFLQPNAALEDEMSAERKAQMEQSNSVKMHASLLAQSLLTRADPVQQLVLDSLVACDADFLVRLAKDRTATHVLQAAINPEVSGKPIRRQIVQKMLPRVVELSLDTIGSHVVDAMSAATSGLHFVRERVAAELAKSETEMKDSYSGRQVWRNWLMDLYQRRRTDWIAKVKEQDEAVNSVEPGQANKGKHQGGRGQTADGKPKTAIEAARARFDAEQRKQSRGVKVTGGNRTAVASR